MNSRPTALREPLYEVSMYDPQTHTRAFLVIDSLQTGVAGGGIRMTPHVTLDEVRRLARSMTYKLSAVRVPAGGSKAGIVADPGAPDKKVRLRAFAKMMEPFLKTLYVPGEDMGTTAEDVAYIYEVIDYSLMKLSAKNAKKYGIKLQIPDDFDPSAVGDVNLELILTGHGVAQSIQEACTLLDINPAGARVAIQGFGTVGSMTADFLAKKGFSIVAVADVQGTVYHPQGLPVAKLLAAADASGNIDYNKLDFEHQVLQRDEWLAVEADILIPAAVPDTIHGDNVGRVKAQLIVEAANIPVTEEAEKYLFEKGVAIVPDFIANAGAAGGLGIVLTGQVPLDPPKILDEIGQRIKDATRKVLSMSRAEKIQPRQAAIKLAEEFLADSNPFA